MSLRGHTALPAWRRVYRTWIPADAKEVIGDRYLTGARMSASYFLGGEKVGFRTWYEDGGLEFENAFRDGVRHGNEYSFYPNGQLLEVTPYRDNRIHGTCRQWSEDGRLLVNCRVVRNTGLDLWCGTNDRLSEERYWPKSGLPRDLARVEMLGRGRDVAFPATLSPIDELQSATTSVLA
jgi:MORN repeat variant